ncbi:MAG: hypothetical protein MHMPM18_004458, partial [Marteilia pararefringens]
LDKLRQLRFLILVSSRRLPRPRESLASNGDDSKLDGSFGEILKVVLANFTPPSRASEHFRQMRPIVDSQLTNILLLIESEAIRFPSVRMAIRQSVC